MDDRPNPTLDDVIRRLDAPGRAPVAVRTVHGDSLTRVSNVTHDSRAVTAGSMLFCIRGSNADGTVRVDLHADLSQSRGWRAPVDETH